MYIEFYHIRWILNSSNKISIQGELVKAKPIVIWYTFSNCQHGAFVLECNKCKLYFFFVKVVQGGW